MRLINNVVITVLWGLSILPACGSNFSEKQKDSANTEQTSTPIKEKIQRCPLDLTLIEEELAFEAILRDGKAWLRFPRSLREKVWSFYSISNIPLPSFHYAANDEYEVSGLSDECAKIVFVNRGQQWDNPMLYFIQKNGTVRVLSFLRAIWFNDFEALRHPAPKGEVVDVVSRDEEESGYRSAFAILKGGKEVELETSYIISALPEEDKNPDGSPKSTLVTTDDFRIFFVTKSKNGLWQEALAGSFVSNPDSQEAPDVLDYHFTHRKTYSSNATRDAAIDMRGTMLGKWRDDHIYTVTSRNNTAPFERTRRYYLDF